MSDSVIFFSHSAKSEEAKIVLEFLWNGLTEAHFEVLLDRKLLEVGALWRDELDTWMSLCNAAVVLLSENALGSEWVKKEAAILKWRHTLDSSFDVLPVLIPPVTAETIRSHSAFEPFGLQDLQFATAVPGGEQALLDQVLERLDPLKSKPQAGPMDFWVDRIAFVLAKLEAIQPKVIDAAAAEAKRDLGGWNPVNPKAERLAREMLHWRPDEIRAALNYLRCFITDEKDLASMVEIIAALWVDPQAAASIPDATRRPEQQRGVAINASHQDVAGMYARRGMARQCHLIRTSNAGGEADAQRLTEEIIVGMELEFGEFDPRTPEEITQFLRDDLNEPVFVAVDEEGLLESLESMPPLLDQVRDSWPSVTFILLTGDRMVDRSRLAECYIQFLDPKVPDGQEKRARGFYRAIKSLKPGY
jgi:hypothetical protein